MRTIMIALLVLLTLPFVRSYVEPIGVVALNNSEYALGWNQNPSYPNETYFNVTSGLVQHSNYPNRSRDITYNVGLARRQAGEYSFYGVSEFLGNIENGTDWATYYWLSARKNVSAFSSWFYFVKNNTQGVYDEYVRQDSTLLSGRNASGDFYYIRAFTDVDVGRDSVADYLIVYLADGSIIEFLMNNSWVNWSSQVTGFVINGIDYSYRVYFDRPQIARFNKTSNALNGDLSFFEGFGNVEAYRLYSFSNLWIDAACTITCGAGSTISVTDNVDFESIFQYEPKTRNCKYNHINAFFNNCTMSADCTLGVVRNVSTVYAFVDQTGFTLKCNNQTVCEKNVHQIPKNTFVQFEPRGWSTGNASVKCTVGNILYSPTAQPCETNKTWINISIINPANNTNLSLLNVNWSILNATYYGNPYTNFSLLVAQNTTTLSNASAVYTDSTWQGNISYNQSFLTCGFWTWEVQACVFTICSRSINGTMNITKDCRFFIPIIEEGGVIVELPRQGDKTDPRDVYAIIGVAGSLLVLLGFFLIKKRRRGLK